MTSTHSQTAPPDLSFVMPVFNERESVAEVCRQCADAASSLGLSHEIVIVDDGSTDGTDAVLNDLAANESNVTVVVFQRNFGKSAALAVGLETARGETLVTLDADLQDNPEELPKLLAALDDGNDVVVGWKQSRRDSASRVLASRLFNRLVSVLAGRRFRDCNSGFKAMRRSVIAHLELYGERHRFLPLLAHWRGFRVAEVPVRHEARRHGRSKYGAGRFIAGFFDLWSIAVLTRFRHKPLHFFGLCGAAVFGLGVVVLSVLTVLRLTIENFWFADHLPWVFFGILLVLVGVQVFTTGLICELIVNLRPEGKAEYVIKETLDSSSASEPRND